MCACVCLCVCLCGGGGGTYTMNGMEPDSQGEETCADDALTGVLLNLIWRMSSTRVGNYFQEERKRVKKWWIEGGL